MSAISTHITTKEATHSATALRRGIENVPNDAQLQAMRLVAEKVFEPLRAWVGGPIAITSFFRSPELNRAIGGSPTSQHCMGQAMDLDMDAVPHPKATNAELFHHIRTKMVFDQLIWEFGDALSPDWVHVSYSKDRNRMQVLRAVRTDGRTRYIPWKP